MCSISTRSSHVGLPGLHRMLKKGKTTPIVPYSRLSLEDTDMLSVMGVGRAQTLIYFSLKYFNTEDDRRPAPTSPSSDLILRDQDGTVATLKNSAAGMPFCLLFDVLFLMNCLLKRRIPTITYFPWP